MCDNRADHDFRVDVVDMAASSADVSFHRIAVGYATFEVRTRCGRNGTSRLAHCGNSAELRRTKKEQKPIKFDATSCGAPVEAVVVAQLRV